MLVGALDFALQRAVDDEALDTADAVADLVDEDALPDPIPVSPRRAGAGRRRPGPGARGSAGADRLVPCSTRTSCATARTGEGRSSPATGSAWTGRCGWWRSRPGRPATRYGCWSARSTADVTQGVHLLRIALLIAFPLLVALLAVVAWRVVGATLRPVEALRAGAEEITGGGPAGPAAGAGLAATRSTGSPSR